MGERSGRTTILPLAPAGSGNTGGLASGVGGTQTRRGPCCVAETDAVLCPGRAGGIMGISPGERRKKSGRYTFERRHFNDRQRAALRSGR